jgi:uncharacterized membrane protein YhaH (DUF805 family)
MNYYTEVLKKYTVFSGRARRAEFWMFQLINLIISLVLTGIDAALGLTNVLSGIYGLAVLLPSLGVSCRRLHDIDRSGWWMLIGLIPIVGWIIVIIWYAKDGDPGDNRFGPNPKAGEPLTA